MDLQKAKIQIGREIREPTTQTDYLSHSEALERNN
jgi:hypothetical protein